MGNQTFVGDESPHERAQSFIDLIYETSDGYISVAVQSNKEWEALTRALEQPGWLEDPRFRTAALRHQNIDDRLNLTQEVLRTRSSEEWLQRLEAEDVPCAPVLKRREMIRHPQVIANETLVETEHPLAGRLRQARPAAQFSQTPAGVRFGAPALGEHTDTVLAGLGYQSSDIAELRAQGVIGPQSEG
jgi:crotonobetainyl-CoA:carnitine CoA-transferase CaiB-like acyl-CoA transferase